MSKSLATIPVERVEQAILLIRGEKVILDADLAALYGVETKALNRAVKRNIKRFPSDFVFQLTDKEIAALRYQSGTSNLKSQNATSRSRGGRRYRPYAFTEHGALMAANVLNSERAVQASVEVVRAFVRLRQMLASNANWLENLKNWRRSMTRSSGLCSMQLDN